MPMLTIEPAFFVDSQGHISNEPLQIPVSSSCPISILKIPHQVVMPGFVNTHSHVFQRLLRGLTEKSSGNDNFWSWREHMYRLANTLSPDDFFVVAQFVYQEMLEAGFTHVGEFHYVHHARDKKAYQDPLAISRALKKAAEACSIKLSLLISAYHQSNFNTPALPSQQRFIFEDARDFCAFSKAAHKELPSSLVNVGLSIHSVRAVPTSWFSSLLSLMEEQNSVLHIHVSEQEKEVNDCLAAEGVSPIALLAKHRLLGPLTTLVHATQLIDGDLSVLEHYRPLISICPSTEANLGDGLVPLKDLNDAGLRFCIGTDQHVRLDPFHEVQALEEHERLRIKQRSILNRDGDWLYKKLLTLLTTNGIVSLDPMKELFNNDFIGVELPPEYEWHGPDVALEALFLSAQPQHIKTVISAGKLVVHEGQSLQKNKDDIKKELGKIISSIKKI